MDQDNCNAVLINTVDFSTTSSNMGVHFLSIIDESTYESFRRDGAADADFPVKGVPVAFGASFGEFSESRRKYFESQKHSMNVAESTSRLHTSLDATVINAWENCMLRQQPFRCVVTQKSNRSVVVRFSWNPPAGVHPPSRFVKGSSVTGAKSIGQGAPIGQIFPLGKVFEHGESTEVHFLRDSPAAEVVGGVNLNGYASSFRVVGGSWSLLMRAAVDSGSVAEVDSLLSSGCPIDTLVDDEMNRAIHRAAERGYEDICRLLISRGALRHQKNMWGDTELSIATARHPNNNNLIILLT